MQDCHNLGVSFHENDEFAGSRRSAFCARIEGWSGSYMFLWFLCLLLLGMLGGSTTPLNIIELKRSFQTFDRIVLVFKNRR